VLRPEISFKILTEFPRLIFSLPAGERVGSGVKVHVQETSMIFLYDRTRHAPHSLVRMCNSRN
jgi:hypothetical protein